MSSSTLRCAIVGGILCGSARKISSADQPFDLEAKECIFLDAIAATRTFDNKMHPALAFIGVACGSFIVWLVLRYLRLEPYPYPKLSSTIPDSVRHKQFDYKLKDKKIVVTGGCGYLGSNIVEALLQQGCSVVVFDITKIDNKKTAGAEFFLGDICNFDICRQAVSGADVVIHCASPAYSTTNLGILQKVNVDGTKNLLRASAAEGVRAFVYTSSASVVFDGAPHHGVDESIARPSKLPNPYAETKADAEELVLKANGTGGMRTISLRPHTIFGPNDPTLTSRIIGLAQQGKFNIQIGDGKNLSDFTFVANVAHAHLLAAKALLAGERSSCEGKPYFITNCEPLPFWDFLAQLLNGVGLPAPKYMIPYSLLYYISVAVESFIALIRPLFKIEILFSPQRVLLVGTTHYYDAARATRDFGYEPLWSMRDALQICVADYLQGTEAKKSPAKSTRKFTVNEVTEHNKEGDLWIVVRNKVYDVSNYLGDHPGGEDAILRVAGKDATKEVEGPQHPPTVTDVLIDLHIGELATQ